MKHLLKEQYDLIQEVMVSSGMIYYTDEIEDNHGYNKFVYSIPSSGKILSAPEARKYLRKL